MVFSLSHLLGYTKALSAFSFGSDGGISRIKAYLGEFKNVPDMIGKVVPSIFADLGTVVSLFAALTSGSHTKRDQHIHHMAMQTTFFWQWRLPRV